MHTNQLPVGIGAISMVIGSQDTTLSALRLIRILADEAHKELGERISRKTLAAKELTHTLERLSSIVRLMDIVVLREMDLALIPNAPDTEQRIVGLDVCDLLNP